MYPLPAAIWLLVLIGAIGLPTVIFAVLWRGALVYQVGRRTAIRVVAAAGLGWALWTVTSYLLADAGVYRFPQDVTNPLIGVAGLAAMVAALLCTRIPVVSRILAEPDMMWRLTLPHILRVCGGAAWFNVLGLLDLAVAITVGFLAAPGPTQLLTVTPSTQAIALLPLVLIPTVMVPMAVALHVVSLTKIRTAMRASRPATRQGIPIA